MSKPKLARSSTGHVAIPKIDNLCLPVFFVINKIKYSLATRGLVYSVFTATLVPCNMLPQLYLSEERSGRLITGYFVIGILPQTNFTVKKSLEQNRGRWAGVNGYMK